MVIVAENEQKQQQSDKNKQVLSPALQKYFEKALIDGILQMSDPRPQSFTSKPEPKSIKQIAIYSVSLGASIDQLAAWLRESDPTLTIAQSRQQVSAGHKILPEQALTVLNFIEKELQHFCLKLPHRLEIDAYKEIADNATDEAEFRQIIERMWLFTSFEDRRDWENTIKSFERRVRNRYFDLKAQAKGDLSPLLKAIADLVEQDLNNTDLNAAILAIATTYTTNEKSIWKLYSDLKERQNQVWNREETKLELEDLQRAVSDNISLDIFLPQELACPINRLAQDLNLRPEVYATALLSGLSSVLNPKTKLILHRRTGWEITPGLYGGIVANSSQKKSPVIKEMISKPLNKLQAEARARYEAELKDYTALQDLYDSLKKSKKQAHRLEEEFPDGPPVKPTFPVRYYSNTTGEQLKSKIAEQPDQGILYLVDELAGLFNSLNAYRGGRGSDVEDLLSLYDGSGFSIGRKSGDTFVEQALLSIFGSIQPHVLQKLLGDCRDSNGQWARVMLVNQPLTASVLPPDTGEMDISPMIEALYRQMSKLPAITCTLSSNAFSLLKDSVDFYEQERIKYGDNPMGNVLGKAGGRIGKLALNLHLIRYAFHNEVPPTEIDEVTLYGAIALTDFYTNQMKSVYAQLDTSSRSMAPHLLKILNLSQRKGKINARDIQRSYNGFYTNDKAISYMEELVSLGYGTLERSKRSLFFIPKDNCQPSSTTVSELSGSTDSTKSITSKPSSLNVSNSQSSIGLVQFPNNEVEDQYLKNSNIDLRTTDTKTTDVSNTTLDIQAIEPLTVAKLSLSTTDSTQENLANNTFQIEKNTKVDPEINQNSMESVVKSTATSTANSALILESEWPFSDFPEVLRQGYDATREKIQEAMVKSEIDAWLTKYGESIADEPQYKIDLLAFHWLSAYSFPSLG